MALNVESLTRREGWIYNLENRRIFQEIVLNHADAIVYRLNLTRSFLGVVLRPVSPCDDCARKKHAPARKERKPGQEGGRKGSDQPNPSEQQHLRSIHVPSLLPTLLQIQTSKLVRGARNTPKSKSTSSRPKKPSVVSCCQHFPCFRPVTTAST